ncbi:Os05g0549400 [Oryza sativa Japonica Group]|nr:Os05g0549400 [Oryza sativa Japonica Group]
MDDDGSGEDDNWLKLSLAPVVYGDTTGGVNDDDDSSRAPTVMTSTEERPATAACVASRSLIPNGAVPVFPCFNFLGTSTSSSSLSHLHQQSSSTLRQSNVSMASSSGIGGGDDNEALGNIVAPNVPNGGGNDNNGGNAPPDPPYPWATNEAAKHHSLAELTRRDIKTIRGEARCRRCDTHKMIKYDIATKFQEVSNYFRQNYQHMNDRAQARWMNPVVPNCDNCGHEKCMRPVIAAEKERINWLFLLLGETLGLRMLDQLKYFCAHTNRHRTGAKDRVLFSTYEELCNQLAPGLITCHDQSRMC